jgi:methylation protein EvaC
MFECKITKKKIKPFMTFGQMPLANNFLKKKDFNKEYFFEMSVGFNEDLSLFQLGKQPKAELMFNNNYPFYTGSSKFMIDHFEKFAMWLNKNYLAPNSNLIEIGSNDGTFLNNFKSSSINFVGIEPSKNMSDLSNKKGIKAHNFFFNLSNVKDLKKLRNNTDVITAANVICHVKNLESLIYGVEHLLNSNGFFIFEEPYLGSMYEKVSYDQIYDEHVFMFSVHSIKKIFEQYKFKLVDVMPQPTHGGSMRYIVTKKKNTKVSLRVQKYLDYEKKNNIDNIEGCLNFKNNCIYSKKKLIKNLNKIRDNGKKIVGYAATSKSTTILNYCGINQDQIDCIFDTTKEKIGKFTPGTHIPIYDMKRFQSAKKDYVYLFAWNHKDEIFKKEKNFTNNGGKWISHVKI